MTNNIESDKQTSPPQLGHPPVNAQPAKAIQPATVDLDRQRRCGFGEVIYGDGKTAQTIRQIADAQLAAGQTVLATRVDPADGPSLAAIWPAAVYDDLARTLTIDDRPFHPEPSDQPHVAVLTAGSTDAAVAAEAAATLRWMRIPHRRYDDIGVAGPWRLTERIDQIRTADVVIVVAGMEGALPSVVAGHVAAPVIAVPTSVGYGANLAGITPLLSALASCSAGVLTVGIDAGFKGGYCAGLIVSKMTTSPNGKSI